MRIVRSSSLALAGATLAIALSVSAMTASAASTFLLQFDTHATEDGARQQWDTLQSNYPDLLGNMSIRVAPVGGEYRTQASGVVNRDMAQKTCNRLAVDDVRCMVVETSMYMPSNMDNDASYSATAPMEENITVEMMSEDMQDVGMEGSTTMTPQPALAAQTTQPVEAPQDKNFRETLLPWLSFGKDEKEAPAERPTQAQVVAPAPVQVSDAPRPQRVDQAAWPENVDRTAAASMSESLPTQRSTALRPGETRVVASRAPRTLQAPNQAVTQPVQPQVIPAAPQPQAVSGEAQVEVAEAIQVPLSFGNAAPVPVNKPVGYGGFPSQPLPERTLWVQLSHFASKEAAMGYWRSMTTQNPEMMRLLRVRIISPWRSRTPSLSRAASLRMGPFSDREAINRLCGVAAQNGLRCTMVQEVGSTAAANVVRRPSNIENHNRRTATSRGYTRTAGATPGGMYWVQLGAFGSVAEAKKRWGELQATHDDVLGRMQPQISYPALSSSPTPVYHLRTGPFVSKSSAIRNCTSLQTRRVGCVVVQSR